MDYKAIKTAIDYTKKPIPDVVIKNNKVDGNMNLYRGPKYKTDLWKNTFTVAAIKEVEKICDEAIQAFGYNKTFQ